MKQSILFWTLAVIIMVGSAMYQRMTGPTYPIRGKVLLNDKEIKYTLHRSHGGETNHTVQIETNDESIIGTLIWKRYKTDNEWTRIEMIYKDGKLFADLPHQPPAGKLQYHVNLSDGKTNVFIPSNETTIIRFKGDVPPLILALHVIAMFIGLIFSTRTGIETFSQTSKLKGLTIWTLALITIGGMILGPVVQKYAFGAYWTGWPFGTDLTDNKTAVMFIFWLFAAIAVFRSKNPKIWVILAAIVTLAVYLIPHSLLGSELDYSKLPQQ